MYCNKHPSVSRDHGSALEDPLCQVVEVAEASAAAVEAHTEMEIQRHHWNELSAGATGCSFCRVRFSSLRIIRFRSICLQRLCIKYVSIKISNPTTIPSIYPYIIHLSFLFFHTCTYTTMHTCMHSCMLAHLHIHTCVDTKICKIFQKFIV